MNESIDEIENIIGIKFKHTELLQKSIIHNRIFFDYSPQPQLATHVHCTVVDSDLPVTLQ